MKVLTKTALGALINRTPQGINLQLEEAHMKYLANEPVGDDVVWDSEFLHYKQDTPEVVEQWLRSFGFSKSFDASCEFVISSVLDLTVEFLKDGEKKNFKHKGLVYRRSFHDNAQETNVEGLYRIPLKGKRVDVSRLSFYQENNDLKLYASKKNIDLGTFKANISDTYVMDLHLPDGKAEVEESLTIFKGMGVDFHGIKHKVGSAGVITKFSIDNKGAEAKQAAFVTTFTSCVTPVLATVRQRRVEVFDSNYFIYITYKGSIAFAVEVQPSDFVHGEGEIDDTNAREPEMLDNGRTMDLESLLNFKRN